MIERYKNLLQEKNLCWRICISLVLLVLSLFLNYFAGIYATESASNPVTDIILSNIPVFDVDLVFVYGSILFWIAVSILLLANPHRVPFSLKSVSLFIVIRSFFITLTHIGPFPTSIASPSNFILNKLTFGGDLFFSGHTGLPFLMALIFWNHPRLRYTFIAASLIFGTSAILGHYHYSIDVFAAYFITYSIFHIARTMFRSDLRLFESTSGVQVCGVKE